MSSINFLRLYLDDDCKDHVVVMLKMQGIQVSESRNFSILNPGSLSACFKTASEAAKHIRNILTELTNRNRKEVTFIATRSDGSSTHINMVNIPHEQLLEIIDKAAGIIVSDKNEGCNDGH